MQLKPNFRSKSLFLLLTVLISFLCFNFSWQDTQDDVEPANMKGLTERHNYWRGKLGLPPLKWSNQLAAEAQKWADNLASRGCVMQHSNTRYGENIYWSMGKKRSPQEVVDSWASEQKDFDTVTLNWEKNFHQVGHYTQIVWEKTKLVGCAVAYCQNGSEVWVCNYDPAGNVMGNKPYQKP